MARYYMFHKPAGCITANRDEKHPVVMDYFDVPEKDSLHAVGRLDLDTEGLLFITDDGKWNQQLMNPVNHVSKTYEFWILGDLTEEKRLQLCAGVLLGGKDGMTAPAEIEIFERTLLGKLPEYARGRRMDKIKSDPGIATACYGRIIITEGKKRQIKRMMRAVGCYVIYLKRTAIGAVKLDENLKPGEYRELTEQEIRINCEE